MARSVFVIVVGNLVSKGLGLVREVLFASWFGTSETAAAFRIAQTAYLLPTQALIGDALSAGLLPLYRRLSTDGRDEGRVLLLIASTYGLLFSAIVSGLLFLYAESVAHFIAPGSSGSIISLAASLLQVMALATPFFVLGGTISFIEASFGSYGGIAWRPVLLNIGAIAGAALAVYTEKTHWLATTLVVAHIIFFAWTVFELRKLDRLLPENRPTIASLAQISRAFLGNMFPLLGLPLVAQLNVITERIVSSWIGADVIPAVDYARFLVDTMVQLIAMPLGVLTLAKHGGATADVMKLHVRELTSLIIVLSFPVATFVALNAESIVRILFARGAFNQDSVLLTGGILRWMGGALGLTITGYYLVKALNSQMRNTEALLIMVCAAVASMLVNFFLWKVFGAETIGVGVAVFNAILFILCFYRLELWRDLFSVMFWVLIGCLLQFLVAVFFRSNFTYPYDIFVSAAFAVVIWGVLIAVNLSLRSAISPILVHLPVIRNFAISKDKR